MILGCIADDFTGAADLAGTLVAEGMATTLLTSAADMGEAKGDAAVIALKTRSISPEAAVAQSLEALRMLSRAGCHQILFKYCSTFDSTPAGNIGPVTQALADALGARSIVICPAFPANRRTVYQGNLFVDDRPLSESGMRNHPLNPMTDSDIRRWLALQTTLPIGHVPWEIVCKGVEAIRRAISRQQGLVVVDALTDDDLRCIGRAVADAPLVTGGSAIAMELPANFRRRGLSTLSPVPRPAAQGPAIILSGSCSRATNEQVARYRLRNPSFAIDVTRLLAGAPVAEEAMAFLKAHADAKPLVYSTAAPDSSGRFIAENGTNMAAHAIEQLMGVLAIDAVGRGVRRIVVAGGETSGAVVEALRPGPLMVGKMIAPGVPVLSAGPIGLALKSGNFGDPDFFETALDALEEG